MRRLSRLAAILCLTVSASAAAQALPGIHQYTLDNGLKLIVREDHRAPVVVSQVWYRIGSSYEPEGLTGISHVLEHMMFKGTDKHPAGEFSQIIARNGGRENAFTGKDYTSYFQQLASDRLEIAFKLESDRMANLKLQEADFQKERKVVMEERRMRVADNPISRLYEQFLATAWITNPYRHPPIGWVDDLKNLKLSQLETWYRDWYAPNNAILVVAGDVQPDKVLALAKQYFGPVPARHVDRPPANPRVEPLGERRIEADLPAGTPFVVLGYQVPSEATAKVHWEPPALAVLARILDGGDSARLSRDLVRGRQVAAAVDASYDPVERLDTLFTLDGRPAENASAADLEKALREQVGKIREQGVGAEEVKRAQTQIIADHLYQLDSIFYQAMQIGMLETTGIGVDALKDYERRVRAVTPEQVQAVARKYLTNKRLTVGVLHPTKTAGGDKS